MGKWVALNHHYYWHIELLNLAHCQIYYLNDTLQRELYVRRRRIFLMPVDEKNHPILKRKEKKTINKVFQRRTFF